MENRKQTVRAVVLVLAAHLIMQILFMMIFIWPRLTDDGQTMLEGVAIGFGGGAYVVGITSSLIFLIGAIKQFDDWRAYSFSLTNFTVCRLFTPLAIAACASILMGPILYLVFSYVWGPYSHPAIFFWIGFGFYLTTALAFAIVSITYNRLNQSPPSR